MKILIAGEGGQGVQSIAEILAKAADAAGLSTCYIPNFGVEQRGGVSIAFLQIGNQPISYPKFETADILVVICNRAIGVAKKYIGEQTLLIFDSGFIFDEYIQKLQGQVQKYLSLPARDLAAEKFTSKATNMILLGAISSELKDVPKEKILQEVDIQFSKHPEFKEANAQAYELGRTYAAEKPNQQFKGSDKAEIKHEYLDDEKTWKRYPEFCKGCMLCVVTCPKQAISMTKELNFLGTNLPEVDLAKCTACGACQKICPDGAIRVSKK